MDGIGDKPTWKSAPGNRLSRTEALAGVMAGVMAAAIVMCFFIPFFGHLSDRIWRTRVYVWGSLITACLASPRSG
ncbi:hypothetical protein GCM10009078_07530 [Cupriavidus gilardii]